jgi:hypothetical protein
MGKHNQYKKEMKKRIWDDMMNILDNSRNEVQEN